MVVQSPKNDNSSSLKTIYLEGKSPWGFRIIDLTESNRSILHSSTLAISKVYKFKQKSFRKNYFKIVYSI